MQALLEDHRLASFLSTALTIRVQLVIHTIQTVESDFARVDVIVFLRILLVPTSIVKSCQPIRRI